MKAFEGETLIYCRRYFLLLCPGFVFEYTTPAFFYKKAGSIYEVYEEWAEYLSVVARIVGLDLEDTAVEKRIERGKGLAETVAERAGICAEDD